MFKIDRLAVSIGQKSILQSISLAINPGSVHAIMGPNGSGKSTLAYALMGHPHYIMNQGSIFLDGHDLSGLSIEKRAQAGLFLAFQHPIEIPGVTVFNFIKEAYYAITKIIISVKEFEQLLFEHMDLLKMDHGFAYRNLNAGFSGGEKKRLELLQMLILKPKIAILDEIDSGLDVDAIKIVAAGLQVARMADPTLSIIMITHYPRLLNYITPDCVHIMNNGTIIENGPAALAARIEQRGYDGISS